MADKWERLTNTDSCFSDKETILKVFNQIKKSPDYSKESQNEIGKLKVKIWEMYYIENISQKEIAKTFNLSTTKTRNLLMKFNYRTLRKQLWLYHEQIKNSQIEITEIVKQVIRSFKLNPTEKHIAKFNDKSSMTINSVEYNQQSNKWYLNYKNENEKTIYSETFEKLKYVQIYKNNKLKETIIDVTNKEIIQTLI